MIPLLLAPLLTKLAESGLNLIGNAVLNKGKDFVEEKLGVSLDDAIGTEEGKLKLLQLQVDKEQDLLDYALENRKVDLDYYKVDAADRASARDMNSRTQESENASWLSKNIVAILALIVVIGGGCMIAFIPDDGLRMGVIGVVTLVLGFYFGTSSSNSKKDTVISNLSQGVRK